jgi:hypothetical protein
LHVLSAKDRDDVIIHKVLSKFDKTHSGSGHPGVISLSKKHCLRKHNINQVKNYAIKHEQMLIHHQPVLPVTHLLPVGDAELVEKVNETTGNKQEN